MYASRVQAPSSSWLPKREDLGHIHIFWGLVRAKIRVMVTVRIRVRARVRVTVRVGVGVGVIRLGLELGSGLLG